MTIMAQITYAFKNNWKMTGGRRSDWLHSTRLSTVKRSAWWPRIWRD
jgi:hypothetical protein